MADCCRQLTELLLALGHSEPYQKFTLSKLLCILEAFPKCTLEEWISVGLALPPFNTGDWIIKRKLQITYEGRTTEEPQIQLAHIVTYRKPESLDKQSKYATFWSTSILPNYSRGYYLDQRNETPFPRLLPTISEQICTLHEELVGSVDASKWKLETSDNFNLWQPDRRDEDPDEIFQTEENINALVSNKAYTATKSCEAQLLEKYGGYKLNLVNEELEGTPESCCYCGVPLIFASAMLRGDTVYGANQWCCPECWIEAEEDPEIKFHLYAKENLMTWKLAAIISGTEVDIDT